MDYGDWSRVLPDGGNHDTSYDSGHQPLLDTAHTSSHAVDTPTGWKFGVLSGSATTVLVLIVNVVFAAVAASKYEFIEGRGTLFEGDCAHAKRLNIGIHLIINILGILLLSASNYSMQVLSAPTRSEIDKAHAVGFRLDIGIPSMRNLRKIALPRVVLWLLLALTSVPLHLFYNSAVFAALSANQYTRVIVNPSFLETEEWIPNPDIGDGDNAIAFEMHTRAKNGSLEEVDDQQCVQNYGQQLQGRYGSVVIVVDAKDTDDYPFLARQLSIRPGIPLPGSSEDRLGWMCGGEDFDDPCTGPKFADRTARPWKFFEDRTVQKCLMLRTPEKCTVQLSKHLIIVIIACNFAKALIMAFIALRVKEFPILTVGDAIANFLEKEDKQTRRFVSVGGPKENDARTSVPRMVAPPSEAEALTKMPKDWSINYLNQREKRVERWRQVVSHTRWTLCVGLTAVALGISMFLMFYGISQMSGAKDFKTVMTVGFGTISFDTLIFWKLPSEGAKGLLSNALVANLPQLILSSLYFLFNGIYTCMCQAKEWSEFGYMRKVLRVSVRPRGNQRTTYFLQLPYRFAVPLMVLSGILHWLVSQSIYLVNILVNTPTDESNGLDLEHVGIDDVLTCGYSPAATFYVILLGTLFIVTALGIGMKKFKRNSTPIAGSSSISISRYCHIPYGSAEPNASSQPLRFGILQGTQESIYGFSSKPVAGEDIPLQTIPSHSSDQVSRSSLDLNPPPVTVYRYG